MLTHRQLEAFRHTLATGSVSAAARVLNTSQPNVSRLLFDLEKEVGHTLFVRGNRGMLPTPEAQMLYQEVERFFIGVDKIQSIADSMRGQAASKLTIGCFPEASLEVVPEAIARWRKGRPHSQFAINVQYTRSLVDAVRNGRCDIAVCDSVLESDDIQVVAAEPYDYVAVVHKDHPAEGIVSLLDLCNEANGPIVVPKPFLMAACCSDGALSTRLLKEDVIDGNTCQASAKIARACGGVAVVDPLAASESVLDDGMRVVRVTNPPQGEFVVITPRRRIQIWAINEFANLLSTTLRDVLAECTPPGTIMKHEKIA